MTRLFRYRKPSVKTRVGVTKAKKRLNRATGITAAKRPFRAPQNMERRVLRRAGYYSGPMKFMRFLGNVMHRQSPHNQLPFNSQPTEAYQQPQQPYMLYPPPPPGQFPPPRPLPHTRFLTWWKKRTKVLLPVFVVILAMLLSACGGGAQSASSSPSPTATSIPSPTPTSTPHVAHAGQSADQILQGLKAHGLPIGVSFTYTAANDLNHLLGRPGQYIGKVNFKDTRITGYGQGANISVSDGGSIEVFANPTEAKKRFAYLQSLSTSGNALFAEYEYLDSMIILRISTQLTPDQAKQYLTALKALP
jgi:hypothetical protein